MPKKASVFVETPSLNRIVIREKGPHYADHIINFPTRKATLIAFNKALTFYEKSQHDSVCVAGSDKIVILSADIVATVTVYLKGKSQCASPKK